MLYEYSCPSCHTTQEVWQSMQEAHEVIACRCGELAYRVWTVPYAVVENGTPHFHHALGCTVSSKRDVKDAVQRVYDTTGQRMIEVGDQKVKVKPVETHYPTASELGY